MSYHDDGRMIIKGSVQKSAIQILSPQIRSVLQINVFFLFVHQNIHVVGIHYKHLNEALLISMHNTYHCDLFDFRFYSPALSC